MYVVGRGVSGRGFVDGCGHYRGEEIPAGDVDFSMNDRPAPVPGCPHQLRLVCAPEDGRLEPARDAFRARPRMVWPQIRNARPPFNTNHRWSRLAGCMDQSKPLDLLQVAEVRSDGPPNGNPPTPGIATVQNYAW